MASTKYTVFANDIEIASKGKKQVAVDLATATRDAERVAVRVVTDKGTVVFEQDAPKRINMSAPYTRTVVVPDEVVERIDGARVAYKRGRKGAQFALLDDAKGAYRIWDVDLSENVDLDEQPSTTREAGRWFADERVAYRAAHPIPVTA